MTSKNELIAVDIGNSRISCGLFNQGVLVDSWYFTRAEVAQSARDLISRGATNVAVSSVVPDTSAELAESLTDHNVKVLQIKAGHPAMPGIYPTMGADRIANAIAGFKIYSEGKAAVVIDLGTATTLTAVDKNGVFAGGFITLGLGKSLTMLAQATAALPHATPKSTLERQLGLDTESAIVNGTMLGHIGIVEHWIRVARRQLGEVTTIATGGWSELVARHSNCFDITDSLLTLKGVYLIAEEEAVRAGQG